MGVNMYNNPMLRLEKSYTLEKQEKTLTTEEYYENFVDFNEFITDKEYSIEDIDTILHLTLFNEKRKLLQQLNLKIREDETLKDSMILSTGYCNICPKCTRRDGAPCRYPKNKLYSIESIGALVTKTTETLFDKEIQWIDDENGIIPEYLTILMGLLY